MLCYTQVHSHVASVVDGYEIIIFIWENILLLLFNDYYLM